MADELFIPKLGQTVEEVTLVDWLIDDGTKVEFGVPILDVETDKAVFPIKSPGSGYLHRGPFKAGDVVPVLTIIGFIGKKDETFLSLNPVINVGDGGSIVDEEPSLVTTDPISINAVESIPSESSDVFVSPRARKLALEKNVNLDLITPTGYGGIRVVERDVTSYLAKQPKVTPVAQNMAVQAGIDALSIQGSGIRGRVTKADVEQIMKVKEVTPTTTITTNKELAAVSEEVSSRVPLKGVKGIVFERMGASVHTTARVTLVIEADATEFVQIREKLKSTVTDAWGFAPGFNDLLGLIVARALKEFPYMNARVSKDGSTIEWLSHINLGLAVDTERGLLVPVIKDADQKGLKSFGSEFRALVDRARAGRSLPEDISGGTFTLTNLGMYDIDAFTPVINMPEIAILGVGRIAPKVVPIDNTPVIRQMWTLSLVFDHRLVDGAPAAKFLQRIKQYIENPYLLIG